MLPWMLLGGDADGAPSLCGPGVRRPDHVFFRLLFAEHPHQAHLQAEKNVREPITVLIVGTGVWSIMDNLSPDQGVTVLLVEQDVNHSLSLSDRGYVLEHGRTVMEGPALGLLNDPPVKTAYLGV